MTNKRKSGRNEADWKIKEILDRKGVQESMGVSLMECSRGAENK